MFARTAIPIVLACLGLATASPIAEGELAKRQSYTGEATVNPVTSGAYGSCGTQLDDSQYFVALSNTFMNNQYQSPYCGQQIQVTNTGPNGDNSVGGQGNTVTVTVADTCTGCSEGHVDLSVAAWNSLTDNSAYSHVGATWSFV